MTYFLEIHIIYIHMYVCHRYLSANLAIPKYIRLCTHSMNQTGTNVYIYACYTALFSIYFPFTSFVLLSKQVSGFIFLLKFAKENAKNCSNQIKWNILPFVTMPRNVMRIISRWLHTEIVWLPVRIRYFRFFLEMMLDSNSIMARKTWRRFRMSGGCPSSMS